MEALLVFVTILAVVSSRNIPNTNYVPTKEQLEVIFGSTSPNQTEPAAVAAAAVVPHDCVFTEKPDRPYQKKNVLSGSDTPKTAELNIKIKVNDCGEKGGSINKTTADGTLTVKQNPENDTPKIHSRIVEDLSSTDDRVSLEVDSCPSDRVRFGGKCVAPD